MDNEKSTPVLHEHAEKSINSHEEEESMESLAIRRKVERRLVWKQDLTMLPLLALCFFFSYVVRIKTHCSFNGPHSNDFDRIVSLSSLTNSELWKTCTALGQVLSSPPDSKTGGQIGNARIMGLQEDLGLSADKYYNALLVFCKYYYVTDRSDCLSS